MESLPNLHPVLVHFPIALLATALLFDLACFVLRRWVWLDRAAVSLYGLGVLGAGAAVWAGKHAAAQVGPVSPEIERLIADHGDWAFLTVIAFVGTTLLRFEVAWRDRQEPSLRRGRLRLMALVLAIGGQWVLLQTADRGARLVYRHGVAVGREECRLREDLPEVSYERRSHFG